MTGFIIKAKFAIFYTVENFSSLDFFKGDFMDWILGPHNFRTIGTIDRLNCQVLLI